MKQVKTLLHFGLLVVVLSSVGCPYARKDDLEALRDTIARHRETSRAWAIQANALLCTVLMRDTTQTWTKCKEWVVEHPQDPDPPPPIKPDW